MKIEKASSPQTSKATGSVVPKVSMFGPKVGFIIPKNKLSGSLVPSFCGASKSRNIDSVSGEKKEHTARKTKWGPDLTQDAFVRKARLLAYQTRVDQITQQIKMNDLETVEDHDADVESINSKESTHREIDAEELQTLKLERREIIGEILKLNPSYKAPLDCVPLMKEERVLLPINEFPGYNFLGMIYGSGSDTLKRLEQETGAKIQVFGTKRDSAEKVEITSDNKNNQDDYTELYTLVSADTYDKVDAAVALVELLVTPVSGSGSALPVSNAPILDQSLEVPNEVPNVVVAGLAQQVIRPTQIFQDQFQYNVPASVPNNSAHLLSSQTKPGDTVTAVRTGPASYPTEPQPHMPFSMQAYVHDSNTFHPADPLRHTPVVTPHVFPTQPDLSNPNQFSGSHPTPSGMSSMVRPLGTLWKQPAPHNPVRSMLNQDSSFTRWPIPPGPTQNTSMLGITSLPVQGNPNTAFGMAQTASFHSRPSNVLPASNTNQGPFTNTPVAAPQVRSYLSLTQGPSAATIPTHSVANFDMQPQLIRGAVNAASQNPAYGQGTVSMLGPPASLQPINRSSFPPARPVTGMAPRMQFPNSADFVFQSQQLQNSAVSVNSWPGPRVWNPPTLEPTMQKPLDIRAPLVIIPDFPNQFHRPIFRGNLRPHADDQYDRFQPHFTERNHFDVFSRPSFPYEHFRMRDAAFPRMGDMDISRPLDAVFPHMGDMGINRPHQMTNMHGSFNSRPVNDYFPPTHLGRNPQNNHPSSRQTFRPSRSQQAYDPFSPTAASTVPQQQEARTDAILNDQEISNPEG